ncbi:MAG: hypothetical protein EOP51_24405 [Sphingobacteriales bacterium]|nr:MAG: hypothetical protein EOP51_24405 [Sphingobacteriales bacterium]
MRSVHGWSAVFYKRPFSWLLLLCFGVLPWLHLVGRWDHYLSFTLYSGGVPQLYICSTDAVLLHKMVPPTSRRNGLIPCNNYVSAYDWGTKAMNTSPYPQERVFRSIAAQFASQHPQARFYIYRPGFKPTVKELLWP